MQRFFSNFYLYFFYKCLGKFIGFNNEELLANYGFKDSEKLIVMGVPKQTINEDAGFALLTDYEKKHLNILNETFIKNVKELTELEQNFLEGFFLQNNKILFLFFS